MRTEYTLTIQDLFIASWNQDFVAIFWHWILWQPIFKFISRKVLLPKLFTITRCGDILGPRFSSSAKSLESWSRKGSVGACDSVEILPAKSIMSGEFLAVSSLTTSVLRWTWSGILILSSGISSSEVSTNLFPCSTLALATPCSSCTTHVALALVPVLVWGLIL